jgi:hypothetical protein
VDYFPQVNKFIAQARTKNLHVLIFNNDGQNSSQTFALEYMMSYHKVSLDSAKLYMERIVKVRIESNFEQALEMWEQRLADEKVPSQSTHTNFDVFTPIMSKQHSRRASIQRKIAWS